MVGYSDDKYDGCIWYGFACIVIHTELTVMRDDDD
jgi:hypothetical protein